MNYENFNSAPVTTIVGEFDDFEGGIYRVRSLGGACATGYDFFGVFGQDAKIATIKQKVRRRVRKMAVEEWLTPETREPEDIRFVWEF